MALATIGTAAQDPPTIFAARLSRAAVDTAELSKVAGIGAVRAELRGATLTIDGKYSGLLSRATKAHLDRGAAKGLRGKPLFDLTLTPGTDGTISGTVTLTKFQLEDLHLGRLYVQLDSESAPDGNLWGWILPVESRR
jgi:hypothetical protein